MQTDFGNKGMSTNKNLQNIDLQHKELLLDARNIDVKFKIEGGEVHAVKGVDYKICRGETVALVGESGSGKSISARTIMQLLAENGTLSDQTSITFNGEDLIAAEEQRMMELRGNRISMIFQEPMTSLNPIYTIGDQLAEIILNHRLISKEEAMAECLELLKEVRIPQPEDRLNQYPHQMSGGQRQRVMIAMALANKPDLLIADEPTTALDVTVQAQILELLRELQVKHNMAVLLITHDLTIVKKVSDRVYVMKQGELVEHNTTEELFANPGHPYTQLLLNSEPTGMAPPLSQDQPVIMNAKKVRVDFTLKETGWFRKKREILTAVKDLDLCLQQGETLGLVGESGSGKTTFGQALIRLLESKGDIHYRDHKISEYSRNEMRALRKNIQIVFQDPFSSLNPRMSVKQLIEEGMIANSIGTTPQEREQLICQALIDSGLESNILNRFPHEFSGGQRQRLAIARVIALNPDFILLDEPTSALDLTVQKQIIELLRSLREKRNLSYLFISHDLRVIKALCHRIIVMNHGDIVEQGPTEEIINNPKQDYTRKLFRAAFDLAA